MFQAGRSIPFGWFGGFDYAAKLTVEGPEETVLAVYIVSLREPLGVEFRSPNERSLEETIFVAVAPVT